MTAPPRRPRALAALLLDPCFLAAVVLAFGVARAASLSITHDEALNYFFYLREPWSTVLTHGGRLPSNDHLLNTVAAKALLAVLPPTELVLRLPALAGLALYLGAAVRLAARASSALRRAAGFLLLAGNPFVLDLLVLSRGYALGLGLTLVAWAIVLAPPPQGARARRPWPAALAAAAAGLAVAANLSFLLSLAALACAAAALAAARGDPASRLAARAGAALAAAWPFGAAAAALAAVYPPAALARIRGPLAAWGGTRGLWSDTVPSLVDGTLYGARWLAPWRGEAAALVTALVAAVLVAAALRLALPSLRARAERGALELLGAGLTFAAAWGAQAVGAHALVGMRYPIERGAVVVIPCVTLLLLAHWEIAARSSRGAARLLPALAATVALVHFAACANLAHTFLWRYDAGTRAAMAPIAAAAGTTSWLRLGVSWQLEPAVNFYRVTRGIAGLAPVTREDPRRRFDLYFLTGDDRAIAGALGLARCAEYPAAGSLLASPPGRPCPAVR